MRPKKHFIAAEIKEGGLVFDSDSYDCVIAAGKLMDTSMAEEPESHKFESSAKIIDANQANQSPGKIGYGWLDNTINVSPQSRELHS